MVPPSSDQVSRVWPYSGICAALSVFTYVVLTLSDRPSHAVRLTDRVLKAVRTPKVFLPSVCPLPRSLATTYGISFDDMGLGEQVILSDKESKGGYYE